MWLVGAEFGHFALPEREHKSLKNRPFAPKRRCIIFQPWIFRGKLAVSFREGRSCSMKVQNHRNTEDDAAK